MKRILITGGDGDISSALYDRLSSSYIVNKPSKDELDVSSVDSVEEYFRDKWFDIIINSAGTLYSSYLLDSDPYLWIKDINVNLIGTYLVSREALIKNVKCFIINISSTAAFNSYSDWTSYCASKAGVLKLSEGVYKEGFNVITLCPGAINTQLRSKLNISNNNIMTIGEGIKPIIDTVEGRYNTGDIIFYRKNNIEIIKKEDFIK